MGSFTKKIGFLKGLTFLIHFYPLHGRVEIHIIFTRFTNRYSHGDLFYTPVKASHHHRLEFGTRSGSARGCWCTTSAGRTPAAGSGIARGARGSKPCRRAQRMGCTYAHPSSCDPSIRVLPVVTPEHFHRQARGRKSLNCHKLCK